MSAERLMHRIFRSAARAAACFRCCLRFWQWNFDRLPASAVFVQMHIDAVPVMLPARPMVRRSAFWANNNIILRLEWLLAYKTGLSGIICHKAMHFLSNSVSTEFDRDSPFLFLAGRFQLFPPEHKYPCCCSSGYKREYNHSSYHIFCAELGRFRFCFRFCCHLCGRFGGVVCCCRWQSPAAQPEDAGTKPR